MKFLLCAILLIFSFAVEARYAPDGFADVAAKILPSVVSVEVNKTSSSEVDRLKESSFDNPLNGLLQKDNVFSIDHSVGSGFIIDSSGLIMTNYHVLDKADVITVTLHNGKEISAEIVGFDKKTDIALLKINTTDTIHAVRFGNSDDARIGDWILAVGNPFGLGNSVTTGIISARARDINSGPYDDYIQTDAPLNHGNSGGPMFNMNGDVIGINTAIFSPQGGNIGIGFAIPSNIAKWVYESLIKYGRIRRGMLGVKIQELSKEIADSIGIAHGKGVLVAAVDTDTPAYNSGILVGDVILKYDSEIIRTPKQLTKLVAESKIGKSVDIVIARNHKETVYSVIIAEMNDGYLDDGFAKNRTAGIYNSCNGSVISELGITVADITSEIKEKYKITDDKGIIVCDVFAKTEAMRKNLREGNIIKEANQQKINSVSDFLAVIKDAKLKKKRSILFLVKGDTGAGFAALKIAE